MLATRRCPSQLRPQTVVVLTRMISACSRWNELPPFALLPEGHSNNDCRQEEEKKRKGSVANCC